MLKILRAATLLLGIWAITAPAFSQELTKYVDPFIGTGGHGHTFPGACVPFGMVQLSPDNGVEGWDWCSGYNYSENNIAGFSHLHLSGTGCGDWVDISVMPHVEHIADSFHFFKVGFNHKDEQAAPGFYSVKMLNGVKVSLTATERCGMHKYEFPKERKAFLRFQLTYMINYDSAIKTHINFVNDSTITGYRYSTGWAKMQRVYFAARLSQPISRLHIYDNKTHKEVMATSEGDGRYNAELEFWELKGKPLMMKVGLSSVSEEKALAALDEIKGWDFDKVKKAANDKWETELSKITVKTDDKRLKKIFYTALYHTCISPSLYSDSDGEYQTQDGKINKMAQGQRYTVFSLWDTFRGLHPLLTITQPDRVRDMMNSMLSFCDETGLLPVWELSANETNCMSGYHAVPVLADAVLKGIPGIDANRAYAAMLKSANQDIRGTKEYRQYGFVPQDKAWYSVTKTLEYAYDDWCIAQVAKKLGKTSDYEHFMQKSQAYKLLFDPAAGFIRAKNSDSSWTEPFVPEMSSTDGKISFYEEGNAWQYTFFVPHDVRGLAKQFGGNEEFEMKLERLFHAPMVVGGPDAPPDVSGMIGQYAHGNEPSHHIAYMFSYIGKSWETQFWARTILDSMYKDSPDGYAGNEDCGQMSAWAVWSMMGMYPANPANGEYVFGSPMFDEVTIKLPGDKKFVIKAKRDGEESYYIDKAGLNGVPYTKAYLTHDTIMKGGTLELKMVDNTTNFGSGKEDWPSSGDQGL